MTQKKKVAVIGGILGLTILGGIAWVLVPGKDRTQSNQQATSASADGSGVLGETTDPNSILLNGPKPNNSSGLSVVSGGGANSLGQLTPDTNNQSGSSPAKPKPSPFDPSTFAQYDQYKDKTEALFGEVQAGTGDELTSGKKAAVYYKGWLTNGQLFDASQTGDDGQLKPFVFEMGAHQVIPGWEQALYGMKVGGVRLVIVPPAVGYGAKGQGPIPGNAVLIFQVQLAAVQ